MAVKAILAATVAAAAAVLAWSGVASGGARVTTLRATVGPGFTISLTRNGTRVRRLAPGLYRIVVVDRSSIHNFKLEKSGGTFERALTTIGFTGTKTLTMRLGAGRWEFYCQAHQSSMHGEFAVGAAARPTPAPTTTTTTTDNNGGGGYYG